MANCLHFRRFVRPPQVLHLARTVVRGARAHRHTHDFAEVFWIEAGRGDHLINGVSRELQPGHLVLIRPSDEHDFSSQPGQPMSMMNLAFPAATLSWLAERYGAEVPLFAAIAAPMPPELLLPLPALAGLGLAAEGLLLHRDSRLELERFLLNLGHTVARHRPGDSASLVPDWLAAALRKLAAPEHFRQGPAHFAALAGRSHEHVARTLKAATGLTPTAVLVQARLEYAARQLLLTERDIAELAAEAGFGSLGHFYACFQRHFGTTPRRYRLRQRVLL
jgi:AraC family cel operon transcriptional repressor